MGAWYTIEPGDCISRLAMAGRIAPSAIMNHPANAELFSRHDNPHVLTPGESVYIPEPKQKTCQAHTDLHHRYLLTRPNTQLRIVLEQDDGSVLANTLYQLLVSGKTLEGSTDGDGLLVHDIDPAPTEAWLMVRAPNQQGSLLAYRWHLQIGRLQPVSEPQGVRQRLRNLGFAGRGTSEPSQLAWTQAARRFQKQEQLTESGEADAQTQAQLKANHRC
jgi:N-acetylmuramoyl-L-alanine amidase